MDTKCCARCKENLSLENFAFKNKAKNILNSHCRACQSKFFKQHYMKNKAYYFKRNKVQAKRARLAIRKLKEAPCIDCGGFFHFAAMDFDHRPGTKKKGVISQVMNISKKAALEEIKKCDLVCSNCHRVRTYNRTHQL